MLFSSAMKFFRRRTTRLTSVARDKLETSQAADKPLSQLSRPLPPPQKGRAHLSQVVDVIQTVPVPVAEFDTVIDNKRSADYLSSTSTFLSPIVYNSRLDELATTDSFPSASLRTTQILSQPIQNDSDCSIIHVQGVDTTSMTVVPGRATYSEKDRAFAQDDMENWDEAFDFQPASSEKNGAVDWTPTPAATVRHKANSVSIPIPIPEHPTLHANSLPIKPENWDDSYVYEDEDEDEDDISSLGNPRPTVPPIFSSRHTGSIEDEVDSWGSGSDWSGDGDIEDLTRESFRDDTLSSNPENSIDSQPQPPTSTGPSQAKEVKHSGIPRFGRLAAGRPSFSAHNPSNIPPTKADASNNASGSSFLAKISPVHRWKSPVRDGPTPKRSQPFQVGHDNSQPNDSSTLSKDDKKERKRNNLVLKPSAVSHDVKKQSSRTPLTSTSQSQHQRKDKEKDQEKGKNAAMSPIKRVFSGTPLSPKNASSSGPSKVNQASLPASSSQTSSLSSMSISAEMAEYERELRARKNPPSAPASTMTSPTSKQTISSGTRTRVRYRSKTTTSTTPNTKTSLSSSIADRLPSHSTSTHNLSLSPPNNKGLAPRLLSQTPRRSSLNDLKLKIPERISHAQRDIKRDISDVREFAACVEQLRNLQHVYAVMLRDLRAVLSEPVDEVAPSRVNNTTSLLNLSPKKRRGTVSTTNPQSSLLPSQTSPSKAQILKRKFSLAAPPPPQPSAYAIALNKLDNSYGIWWECAEVLIELGGWRGGNGNGSVVGVDVDAGSPSGNALVAGMITGRRVRAVTLGSDAGAAVVGMNVNATVSVSLSTTSNSPSSATDTQSSGPRPPPASPPKPSQWRATTGRAGNGRDLTARQLAILRDMMMTDDERDGQWDPKAMDAERGVIDSNPDGKSRNRRGLREFWSGFRKGGNTNASDSGNVENNATRSHSSQITSSPAARDSTSFDSSASESNARITKDPFSPPHSRYDDPSIARSGSPRTPSPSKRTVTAANALSRGKKPIRRPSLAGLFGIGQKNASGTGVSPKGVVPGKTDGSSSDWDLLEVDTAEMFADRRTRKDLPFESVSPSKPSTIRGRPTAVYDSPSSPDKDNKSGSQASQKAKKPSLQLPRTPHVFLSSDDASGSAKSGGGNTLQSPIRIHSEGIYSSGSTSGSGIPVAKLALTPENIRPLLKHAREIAAHLNECIGEVRGMMGGVAMI